MDYLEYLQIAILAAQFSAKCHAIFQLCLHPPIANAPSVL
jgi:hypothetical protein